MVVSSGSSRCVARANAREHLAFASGIHARLGAALARIEGTTALRELFETFPELRLTGSLHPSGLVNLRGFTYLPAHLRSAQTAALAFDLDRVHEPSTATTKESPCPPRTIRPADVLSRLAGPLADDVHESGHAAGGRVARFLPTFAAVKHRGRKSGTPYETVVNAYRKGMCSRSCWATATPIRSTTCWPAGEADLSWQGVTEGIY